MVMLFVMMLGPDLFKKALLEQA